MPSFAHLSDIHIGAFRQPALQDLVLKAFTDAMDLCLQRKVDFIVISGDLFDSNIPDMGLLNSAVRKMGEVRGAGIRFYVIYGSHDFSPTQTSIVDILESAGLFTKVTKGRIEDGELRLDFTTDKATKAKLCGISGRRRGIDSEYFEILDRKRLEREDGFKIFLLHGALSEYKSEDLAEAESMPISNLPKGFAYYAAGHIHEKFQAKEHGLLINYPGTLFGADFTDIEKSANGLERGFFIVNFSAKVESVEFVPVPVCGFALKEYNAAGKTALRVQKDLTEAVEGIDAEGKVVLLKVAGEMSAGKTSDIDFQQLKKTLKERGAIEVLPNYHRLTSKEYSAIKVAGQDVREIEDTLFKENIGTIKVSNQKLKGASGIKLSRDVFDVLKQPKIENETKTTYDGRIATETIEALDIDEEFA